MVVRSEIKAQAKEQIKGNILMLFLIDLIVSIVISLCVIPVVGWIAALFVFPALQFGLIQVYFNMVNNGEKPEIGVAFSKFGLAFKGFVLSLLKSIYIMLWSCLFWIPGIIKTYSYAMAEYIMVENPEMGANEAITKSREIMDGHKWEYFVLQLSFFWWYLLIEVTFGLAAIYVVPYINATTVNFYNRIKGE